ncbi:MAG: TRAP transporter permease [Yaniella sp.]|uniref:TRAP transporter permease n=1 Tax=Yaniella sp. TaxID=2773929 RepID=UPI0026476306|nr:TRAP transporter permease [Yaniella sp.]MDN5731877.1 TRAP transporter permease [Yaniella sp.]MDN5838902.1 TRAP transporter permease [Yaniella sp.]MDN5890126.1 TRAP transporter permease [Yaniella sp.]MDN5912901.1 TRAP transporter permease [Yaniella sp.]MDN6149232.1 TRAP transporter permease [Yaniella sp.]
MSQKNADEVLRKHDTSSRYRTNLGWFGWVVGIISIIFTLYHLYAALERPFNTWIHSAFHLGGGTALIFMLYPASKKLLTLQATGNRWKDIVLGRGRGVPWYDVALAGTAIYCNAYLYFNYEQLTGNAVQVLGYSTHDYIVATLGILLVLEGTRRCVGLPIIIIAVVAILYALFGNYSPVFRHAGMSWETFSTNMFMSSGSGIFSIPIQVSGQFIFLFLFFAVVLMRTNIGQLFNDLAFRLAGKYVGGPAKAAVVASGLQGMISGSAVANTVASGSFTIPMMKKAGFKPHVAAATEATASTGGQLMPPIMGSAAFIMAQNVPDVTYNDIIIIAIIPALLYFLGAFLSVHFDAKKNMLHGLPVEELPTWRSLLNRIDLMLPLVVIVTTLVVGFTPMRAALLGIVTAFLLSFIRASTRLGFRGMVDMLIDAARTALPVIAACATAGIVAGTVTSTGLAGQLGQGLIALAGGSFLIVLVLVMIACIIMGMGLPTTANYVVTSTVAAPILYNNFDVPILAAHFFVFFFGILSEVTPPVCLAAYAGAGLANANPMTTGFTALKIAVAGFLVPYVLIFEPAMLLDGPVTDLIPAFVTVVIGMVALAAGLAGHFLTTANVLERTVLIVSGVLLVVPQLMVSAIGAIGLIIILVIQYRKASRERKNV